MGMMKIQGDFVEYEFMQSEIVKFKDLRVGEKFISMPISGDDNGHGGFKEPYFLLVKLNYCSKIVLPKDEEPEGYNAARLHNGSYRFCSSNMWVIKVE